MIKLKFQFLKYKLVIFKCLNGTIKVGIAAYIAGVASSTWANMTGDAKTLVILSAILAMQTYLDGFMDKTLSDLEKGKSLTDTFFFGKQETNTETHNDEKVP